MLNQITIIGRVVKDAEVRKTSSGQSVTTVVVACDRSKKKNSETGKYEDAGADFFSVQLWGKSAEFAANYTPKGTPVYAKGRMTSRHYQAKDGSSRIAWEITNVEPVGGFGTLPKYTPQDAPAQGYSAPQENQQQYAPQTAPAQGYSAPQGNQQQYAPQTAPAQSSPSEFDPSDFFGDDPFGNSY